MIRKVDTEPLISSTSFPHSSQDFLSSSQSIIYSSKTDSSQFLSHISQITNRWLLAVAQLEQVIYLKQEKKKVHHIWLMVPRNPFMDLPVEAEWQRFISFLPAALSFSSRLQPAIWPTNRAIWRRTLSPPVSSFYTLLAACTHTHTHLNVTIHSTWKVDLK